MIPPLPMVNQKRYRWMLQVTLNRRKASSFRRGYKSSVAILNYFVACGSLPLSTVIYIGYACLMQVSLFKTDGMGLPCRKEPAACIKLQQVTVRTF